MIKAFVKKMYLSYLKYRNKQRVLHSDEFKTFKKNRKVRKIVLLDTPTHGNIGDMAIALAEQEFIKNECKELPFFEFTQKEYLLIKQKIKRGINADDVIVIHGGGFIGTLWECEEEIFLDLLEFFKDYKIVVLPQSVFFEKNEKGEVEKKKLKEQIQRVNKLKIFLREENSYNFMLNELGLPTEQCVLVPDIVTYLTLERESLPLKRSGILICMRNDCEKTTDSKGLENALKELADEKEMRYTDTVVDRTIMKGNRKEEVWNKLNEFAQAELVITDRLHGMIFAAITETPCIAMDNVSKKVSGMFKMLSHLDYIKFVNSEDINIGLIQELLQKKNCKYSNDKFQKDYELIRMVLEEQLA